MSSSFTHLHTHSHYSLLAALPKIDELVAAAKKNEMEALALTDNGNLYGAIEFYKACKKADIKPIIGVDFYVAARSRKDTQAGIDNRRSRLVLLAKDETGYKNLLQLVTASHMEGFYYKPRIDRELLSIFHQGLIAISPSFSGEIAQSLNGRNQDKADEIADFYKKTFGDDLYIEITEHPEIDGHSVSMAVLVDFAHKKSIPIMAAHDVYYIKPEDRFARETILRINTHGDPSERSSANDEDDFSFISAERARELFRDIPEALKNTAHIAEQCNINLTLGTWVFPNYIVPSGLSYDDELRRLTFLGFERRNLPKTEEIISRVEYELKVIKDKGYAPYFLIVSDLLNYAHEHKILTTIRGSVAGSMVTYLSGITNVNPIEYNLPFERFLNPERPSAPDIDMDYADNRRDEMITYVRNKYGQDKVAQIGTFGTMMARGAVRDVARAMNFPYEVGDRISKLIPFGAQGFPMTIDRAMAEIPELKAMYQNDNQTKQIIDMAKKIEGCARHISVHAAGVVIAPRPLVEFTPLQYDPKGEGQPEGKQRKIITQFDMHAIEEAGLLKFDFLGIRNLAILADAVERVKKIENLDIDIENVPVDDKKTFEMLARGETIGTFQLNGDGMTRYLTELKPTSIHDINLMVALYRPGPMENINEYIARKHGLKPVTYLHPAMKKFLEPTYGVLVYQDDLIMTAIEVAGYSWGEVDKFRKAVGKKIPEEMAKQHQIFVAGCIKHGGLTEKKSEAIWKLFEPFQGYGFNKAHAASYGKVAYQTAYMKANFPEIYMSAVLSAESGNIEMIGEIVAECRRMKIPVLPPDVNESYSQFTVVKVPVIPMIIPVIPAEAGIQGLKKADSINDVDSTPRPLGETSSPFVRLSAKSGDWPSPAGAAGDSTTKASYRIRFGLVTIKNFGQGAATAIIEERKKNGSYRSLADFLDRVKDKNLNKKSLESLIRSGALDCFGEDRCVMIANIELLLQYNKENEKRHGDQGSMFSLMNDTKSIPTLRLQPAPLADHRTNLAAEKELLGLYISGHPLDQYKQTIERKGINIKKALETSAEGSSVVFAAIIETVRSVQTKNNETMAFVTLTDFSGSAEAVVFPRIYTEFRELISPEKCLGIKATINTRNGEKGFIIERVKGL
ncbi:MAG: DNA polymerase III subunit alpha [Candidatus Taylorbacteria bacterium RIFCSPLOWO2_01_FULL_44_26]|uniref:DNA polymerase III subunit alpha n=1 Tax=Candidatus Taylorbacteria bacterium RIFCSPLOWO2_01_FULL_44_26 TaxID=1802318 RepID=A0A1G2N8G2_9BACT|nr:MAG: DNA polymerase III subunit alpha [Candidatus Taylorbacteria bacterium RIFCSPLOWO2_01_FULL_44_26]